MADQPGWMARFKHLGHSLKSEDSKKVFNLLWELIGDENTTYRIFRLIGMMQGFFSILEYFAGYARKHGLRWSKIHSDEIVENLLKEIQARKRKTLE